MIRRCCDALGVSDRRGAIVVYLGSQRGDNQNNALCTIYCEKLRNQRTDPSHWRAWLINDRDWWVDGKAAPSFSPSSRIGQPSDWFSFANLLCHTFRSTTTTSDTTKNCNFLLSFAKRAHHHLHLHDGVVRFGSTNSSSCCLSCRCFHNQQQSSVNTATATIFLFDHYKTRPIVIIQRWSSSCCQPWNHAGRCGTTCSCTLVKNLFIWAQKRVSVGRRESFLVSHVFSHSSSLSLWQNVNRNIHKSNNHQHRWNGC